MAQISKDTKITVGTIISIGTILVGVIKFLPSPTSEKYVDDKLKSVDQRFDLLFRQQADVIQETRETSKKINDIYLFLLNNKKD